MAYVVRGHWDGHYVGDQFPANAGTLTPMFRFDTADEACNRLAEIGDAVVAAGGTVEGAGFVRWVTYQGRMLTYRVWQV